MLTKPDAIHKPNYFTLFKKNEQGAILISFMIILPFFIALMFISFEIAHYLQRKAKLSDAIEQATLALTIENNEIPDKAQQIKNRELVLSYANAYLPSERFSDPIINIDDNANHLGYNAAVTMTYPAKFLSQSPLTNTISDINTTDNGRATKNKRIETSETTDVVFVVDYSSSMNEAFNKKESTKKIEVLRLIFKRLNDTILRNDNVKSIGFVPFTWGTKKRVKTKVGIKEYCHFPYTPKKHRPNGDYLRGYTSEELVEFPELSHIEGLDKLEPGKIKHDDFIKIKKELYKIYGIQGEPIDYGYGSYFEDDRDKNNLAIERLNNMYYAKTPIFVQSIIAKNIDYTETINSIVNDSKTIDIPMSDIYMKGFCLKNSEAHSLVLDNTNDSLSDIEIFEPGGDTLISSGILTGNKLLMESDSTNNNKLMVILSDGKDSVSQYEVTKMLIVKGMCNKIKQNNIRMVFIAIGYSADDSGSIDWKKCVGEGNYYEAHNAHELEADLLQAFGTVDSSEVGRNTPKN
ncbi:TadE/TadG family protein [Yersinia enterocolitica]|uniref:pilus assembly protein n=1 Tax=Yersinia enterocolitica TaxID=630 RepID=UPI001C8D7093|nr:pilus assembly protein [Yersinia enterocolitica]MBX9497880.1 TadE/TadG family protein [Yersinia enterocolitica]